MNLSGIILAAGQGTRMKSELPKVLHDVCGLPIVMHVSRAFAQAGIERPVVVVGNKHEMVMQAMGQAVEFAYQEKQLGTGHAVLTALPKIPEDGLVVICAGDMPLIMGDTISKLIEKTIERDYAACVLTAVLPCAKGYGRIIRAHDGALVKIVEERDASEEEKKINEVNTSVYCFQVKALRGVLSGLKTDNAQGELYLTDALELLRAAGARTGGIQAEDYREAMGINDRIQLAQAGKLMQERINRRHMLNGVTLINPESIYIDWDVEIGRDTIIYPNNYLCSGSRIGENCTLYEGNRLEKSRLGKGVSIRCSTLIEAEVGDGCTVGPNAYLRPKAVVGANARIGDFVELKNCSIGDGSKVSHLSYVGDAEVGSCCNIGCGVVFVNYDGKHKFRSKVGDNVFVGSNSNLVAPVVLEDGAYIAAGSTITQDVPGGALCIARARQTVKPGWAEKKRRDWEQESE